MLQVTDERIQVWRSQRELVRSSLALCTKRSEKDRVPAKGAYRPDALHGYDRP